jgi:hypothetical protein
VYRAPSILIEMIGLDDLNQEWAKQEKRLNAFAEKAKKLHDQLIQEVEASRYDLYKRVDSEQHDNIKMLSSTIVQDDADVRKVTKGPTIVKEKFHSSYWKHWNQEKDLLYEISRKELLESPSHAKTKSKSVSKVKSQTSSSSASTGKKKNQYRLIQGDYINHNLKSAIFASPVRAENNLDLSKYFDSHLLGRNNSIERLAVHLENPKIDLSKHCHSSSAFDPDAVGNSFVKGGDIPLGEQRAKQPECVTSKCDITDLSSSLKTIKGGIFGLDRRFPPTVHQPIPSSSSATLPQITPSASSNGFKFSLTRRFPHGDEKNEDGTKKENILSVPGPGNYDVRDYFLCFFLLFILNYRFHDYSMTKQEIFKQFMRNIKMIILD